MPKKDEPQYTHMKAMEIALAKCWRIEGKTPGEIALLLKRDVKTIRKQTDKKKSTTMQQAVRASLGAGADTSLTYFVATVATAVATAVATGPFCVATVATAGKK